MYERLVEQPFGYSGHIRKTARVGAPLALLPRNWHRAIVAVPRGLPLARRLEQHIDKRKLVERSPIGSHSIVGRRLALILSWGHRRRITMTASDDSAAEPMRDKGITGEADWPRVKVPRNRPDSAETTY